LANREIQRVEHDHRQREQPNDQEYHNRLNQRALDKKPVHFEPPAGGLILAAGSELIHAWQGERLPFYSI
jgi:hypothetical protein